MASFAFGLTIESGFPLPGLGSGPGGPCVRLDLARRQDVDAAWSGVSAVPPGRLTVDGIPFVVHRGAAGDELIAFGDIATFHVSPGHDRILCAPAFEADLIWRRTTLDTVLWITALWHGMWGLHASAVLTRRGVVAIAGRSGSGKSTLAAALIRRGAVLFADDVVCLDHAGLAQPGPALMNVPHGMAAGGPAGTALGEIGSETWIEVRRTTPLPARLSLLVILDRNDGHGARMAPFRAGLRDLVGHILTHPFDPADRQGRLAHAATLAAQVPIARLVADGVTTPEALAATVEAFPIETRGRAA